MNKSSIENKTDENLDMIPENDGTLSNNQQEISYDFSGESVFLMTILGAVVVGFCYIVCLIIF